MRKNIITTAVLFAVITVAAQTKPRARDLGVPFEGTPGKYNAITDVPGIEVGYKTIIEGNGKLEPGKGPVRTGVTVILPKGKTAKNYPAAWYSLNGDGEMTGLANIEDYGLGYGPIGITNTNSVGTVRDAIGEWSYKKFSEGDFIDFSFGLPIAAETWDGLLNDINGFHVKKEHVWDALDNAKTGQVQEGNVGGGTGMALYHFKGGSGTASRTFTIDGKTYTLGVFIQANFGGRNELMISGVPVGKEIKDYKPIFNDPKRKDGSAIVIVATDAPLLPSQLKLIAKRVTHGIARTGTFTSDGSGEIFLALSTAEPVNNEKETMQTWNVIPKEHLNPIFKATVQATEEAIINTLVAAEDMEGINNNKIFGLPHDALQTILKKYNRYKK
ncbi:peptidase S58 DmpA [Flavobacterium saliperosum S13]|uniref:L-aminopeptidase/D-esterase n=2 Tax=Flavobacterium saliperosum TaxID=329186 RepID=A0A1G4VQU2_9FLAO|nr:P1 family peptidase [Flavobacterium saliperosum]ESU24137.1 peptidase S58 DmpA [Flavobacterium saliperosum S13]SCX10547.1 L-aminopeptidase/D-esterase [Flavobacterium saliperosum]